MLRGLAMPMRPLFVILEGLLLATAAVLGGPAWVAVTAVACLVHLAGGMRPAMLGPSALALAWLAASVLTNNRELFFPYAMQLAASALVAAGPGLRSLAAAAAVAATFMAVRVAQAATPRVLAVELAAAVIVIAAAAALQAGFRAARWSGPAAASLHWWLPVAAAACACCCLAL